MLIETLQAKACCLHAPRWFMCTTWAKLVVGFVEVAQAGCTRSILVCQARCNWVNDTACLPSRYAHQLPDEMAMLLGRSFP